MDLSALDLELSFRLTLHCHYWRTIFTAFYDANWWQLKEPLSALVLRLWRIFHGSPSGERSQLLDAKEFKALSLPTPQLAHKFLHSYSDFITVSPHYPFRFGFFTIWSFMNGGEQSQLKVAKFCFASLSLFFIWLKLPEATCAKYELITIQNASNPLSVASIRKSKIYLHF